MKQNIFALAVSLAFGALGCTESKTSSTPDSGPPVVLDTGVPDAGPQMSTMFGPCTDDSQCPGQDAVCLKSEDGWTQGFCTVACADRGPCLVDDVYHHCFPTREGPSYCQRRCLNGYGCQRENYTCVDNPFSSSAGVCTGLCSEDADCGGGAVCDEQRAVCADESEVSSPTAPQIGEGCANSAACASGNCIEEEGGETPNGFNGGYCYGQCILPAGYNTNSFFTGADCDETGNCDLPQGTCPSGNVCFPNGTYDRFDPGICLSGCDSDADCRADEGYACQKSFTVSSGTTYTFTRGRCWPYNCRNRDCPSGFECTQFSISGNTYNQCARTP